METIQKLILLTFVGGIICGEYYHSNGTKYYFSNPMKKNWYQAQRYCHSNSMYLATIHSEEENRILLDVIYGKFQPAKADDHFWTSGTDRGETDLQFYWFESGHATLYTNWADGQPVPKQDGCILLHGGIHKYKFWDNNCLNQWYFICQDQMMVPDATKRFMNSSVFSFG